MERKDFTYTYDKSGYVIYYKGQNIGGYISIGKGNSLTVKQVQKQLDNYKNHAKYEIEKIFLGDMGQYRKFIEEIDNKESKNKDN
jgi:hypothetical protein